MISNFFPPWLRRWASVCGLVGLWSLSVWGYDPQLRWKTLRTTHFAIHYDETLSSQAQHVADLCEQVHGLITTELQWVPRGRTHVLLLDEFDTANGWATPVPTNTMAIFLPAPEPDGVLGERDDWVRLVITHEYTHIVHLDMARGIPKIYRSLFGRTPSGYIPFFPSAFPNSSLPSWITEGYATVMETRYTSAGRGRSSWAEMVLRCDILENRFRTLGEMADWQTEWPGGFIRYLYGRSFLESIFARGKPLTAGGLAESHSEQLFPAIRLEAGPGRFGQNYSDMYYRWKRELQNKFAAQQKIILDQPIREGTGMTHTGFWKSGPRLSPDGKWLAYALRHADRAPALVVRDISNGRERVLDEGWIEGRMDWSLDSQTVYYSKMEYRRAYQIRSELYAVRLLGGRPRRLTRGQRASDPAVSPDGKEIAFVRLTKTGHELVLFTLATHATRTLRTGENGEQYSRPTWSPDGKTIAFSRWTSGGKQDIVLYSVGDGRINEVTGDRALDTAPAWSLDGKTLFFSSDRTGVFNLYSYDLVTGEIHRETNVMGGAFFPDPAADGHSLFYLRYAGRGFDIWKMDLREGTSTLAEPYVDTHPPAPAPPPVTATEKEMPYRPGTTLLPQFWIPNFMGGVFLFGRDPLGENAWALNTYNGPSYQAAWTNQLLYPEVSTTFWDMSLQDPILGRGLRAEAVVPFPKILRDLSFSLGYEKRQTDPERAQRDGRQVPPSFPARWEGARAQCVYSNTRMYGYSISPEKGRRIEVLGERGLKSWRGAWDEYVAGWGRHHSINFHMGGGTSRKATFDSEMGPEPVFLTQRASRAGARGSVPAFPEGIDQRIHREISFSPALLRDDRGFHRNFSEAGVAYAFPVAYFHWSSDHGFLFLDRVYGQAFTFLDRYWTSPQERAPLRTFVGVEAVSWWGLGYTLPLSVRLHAEKQTSSDNPPEFKILTDILF